MKNVSILLVTILLASCGTVKKTTESTATNTVQKDTVYILKRETIKDTVIQLKADSSLFEAMIECDSNNQAFISRIQTLENGQKIQTKYVFKDKILRVQSKVNADSIQMYWKNYFETQYKGTETTSATVTDKSFIKRAGAFAWLKWLLIGAGLMWVVMFTKRWWMPLIRKLIGI